MTKEELEKEAEESWRSKDLCYKVNAVERDYKVGFADGYNKAKEKSKIVVEHFEAYGQCRDSRRIASLEAENEELKDKLNNLSKVAEVRLANWQKYEKENEELKSKIRFLQYAGD